MSWNYRIIRHGRGETASYSIHEVFYDEDGNPTARTKHPATFGADLTGRADVDNPNKVIKDEIVAALKMAIANIENQPILADPWPDEVVDVEGLEPPATDES